ncbi:MAG: 4-alpha-glucanotransferase, partial [Blastocatellia bacterium]|nr:4-alpha-glucanotransferase [Blastocatellia bacterium]
WQMLPLGPTGYGDSPYACYSAFGGNTLLISPDRLVADGLMRKEELGRIPEPSDAGVDFEGVVKFKEVILRDAFSAFKREGDQELGTAFQEFSRRNAGWLEDYALFRALKDQQGGIAWHQWDGALVRRERGAIQSARAELSEQIEAQKFYQFLFFRQWFDLKSYCNDRGIKIVGDIPIFVAHDSADVWTNPDQFKLNPDGTPVVVAGVPPDYFSKTGQLWGNPLYNWERMLDDGFAWWIERVKATLQTVDIVRIDHFRGFVACWEIPGGDQTAERGRWVEAPGRELFKAIRDALGELPIIAEDLGVITPEVEKLRDDCGFPGMRILQFAFSSDAGNHDLPHNYHSNVVVYTGTHDNDTTVGWFQSVAGEGSTRDSAQIEIEREFCLQYLNTDGKEINWDFIRAVWSSVANTAVVPLQDLLGLGTDARMNLPNSTSGNWSWRFKAGELNDELAKRLRHLTKLYGRVAEAERSDGAN